MLCLLTIRYPRLLIRDVPDDGLGIVEEALKRAGFLEDGVQYEVIKVDVVASSADLIGRLRSDTVERVTYADLLELSREEL